MKYVYRVVAIAGTLILLMSAGLIVMRSSYRRPYRSIVEASGVDPALVYAVMKTESGFDECAVSRAGAVGLMQLLPSTAEYICQREGIIFRGENLLDGAYNVRLGCMYLRYLLQRFPDERTAICAYNAGEGAVTGWLQNENYSNDGKTLNEIPYEETRIYEKKVFNFKKNYQILYQ